MDSKVNQGSRSNEIDMLNGPLFRKILVFALPLAASSLLQELFNSVDVAVVGHFVGSEALAAVGSNAPVIGLLINLFMGISMGACAIISNHIGQQDDRSIRRSISTVQLVAVLSGLFLLVLGQVAARPILIWMGTPPEVLDQAVIYLRIYFLGMPFFMLYNYGAAVLRAVGDTKRPLMFLIAAGIINACLNMVLVIVFNLGVAGVAIATIFSQFISCVLVLRCLNKTDASYQLRFSKLKIKGYYLKQIFQVGIPAGIQSTVINFSNALLQSSVNSFGSTAMAGYTAANNILGFLYASINSVTQACMSFTSQNYGVRKFKRMDKVLIDCVILSVGASLVFGCGAYIFGDKVLMIYTNSEDVIKCGVEILSITTVPYFLCGIMDLFPGALRGMGYSLVPMILSVIGTVGMRIFWIFVIFPSHRTLYDLFISYPASWTATIIMQVICFLVVRRKVHSQINK